MVDELVVDPLATADRNRNSVAKPAIIYRTVISPAQTQHHTSSCQGKCQVWVSKLYLTTHLESSLSGSTLMQDREACKICLSICGRCPTGVLRYGASMYIILPLFVSFPCSSSTSRKHRQPFLWAFCINLQAHHKPNLHTMLLNYLRVEWYSARCRMTMLLDLQEGGLKDDSTFSPCTAI